MLVSGAAVSGVRVSTAAVSGVLVGDVIVGSAFAADPSFYALPRGRCGTIVLRGSGRGLYNTRVISEFHKSTKTE